MTSLIDITKPESVNATTASVRANFEAAKNEIEALQNAGYATLTGTETLTNKTLTNPDINGGTLDGTPIGVVLAAAGTFTDINADFIRIDGNTISSTGQNTSIVIDPAGSGVIELKVNSTTGALPYSMTIKGSNVTGERSGITFLNGEDGPLGSLVAENVTPGSYPASVGKLDLCIQAGSVGHKVFSVGPSNNATINTGNLIIGTAGKGIDFSADTNSLGMTSELLDDYEEGTYTLTLTPQISGSITLVSTEQTLVYRKVSNTVFVSGRVRVNSTSAPLGNNLLINLPFALAENGTAGMCAITANGSDTFTAYPITLIVNQHMVTYPNIPTINSSHRFQFNFFYNTY